MPIHDYTSQRIFVNGPLSQGVAVAATPDQAHYLLNVLRLRAGDRVLVFNGRDGEWSTEIANVRKHGLDLVATDLVRAQYAGPDIDYLFAPLKRARLDYMVQKATEMGVARLVPVMTQRTVAERVNLDRMRANAIEAAEQCAILRVPEVLAPRSLTNALADWAPSRPLIYCDEAAEIANPLQALGGVSAGAVGVLVGPEGGFSPVERKMLRGLPFAVPISLGPRIMRADTAAIAALALVNATIGDWRT